MIKTKIKSIVGLIKKILYILSAKQRRLLSIVLIMMFINSLLQTLGVSVIVPLVSAMTDADALMEKPWTRIISIRLGIENATSFMVLICICVIIIYVLKNLFCTLQIWVSSKFSKMVQRETSVDVLNGYMHREYDFFLDYGTTKVMRDVVNDSNGVNTVLNGVFNIATEGLTMTLILVYIIAMDFVMALCIFVIAMFCIYIIYHFFKRSMVENGKKDRLYRAETQRILLQSIEGIKEVQVMRKQKFFVKEYDKAYIKQQAPEIAMNVGSATPTYLIEGMFVSGIMAFVCVRILIDPNYNNAVPMLASFMVGAIRMLPSLGRISSNMNTISYNIPAIESVYKNMTILREEKEKRAKDSSNIRTNWDLYEDCCDEVEFKKSIALDNICWHYADSDREVLDGLSLQINKGKSIGIIGQSGTGKSTLADIILGLHIPQNGTVKIDGKDILSIPDEYSRVIGFVPQTVYLVDGTIRENVAFGVTKKDINDQLVWECLKKAQLVDFINEQGRGLDTNIGERGIKLSGGQRQRIAIARALYRKPQILILDEATSALDNETEAEVMDSIEKLYGSVTMLIIAHRLTTVRNCDEIYEIIDGKAVKKDKELMFV